ncbi:hypothetical protein BHE74_00004373 [Ensete ventricosum]|nr:hypothetical protein GW17_00054934 [Ensete ventricosum]RWW86835.1 hypothetical protein BHE74_00004373 [Ensete ventricosum]RZR78228.1 hypothetical protein BHM03_00003507 [Ensete ventricosum]
MAVWWPQSGAQRSYRLKIRVLVMEIERCRHPLSFSAAHRVVEVSRGKRTAGICATARRTGCRSPFASSYHRRPLDSITAVRWFGAPHTGFVLEKVPSWVVLLFVLGRSQLPAVVMFNHRVETHRRNLHCLVGKMRHASKCYGCSVLAFAVLHACSML